VRRALIALAVLATLVVIALAIHHRLRAPRRNVRYVPTTSEVLDVMLELAELSPNSKIYDLGCGDGRVVIEAARRFGAQGVCVEIDPVLIVIAESNARAAGVYDRIRFIRDDVRDVDVSDATVVTLYLSRRLDLELRPRLVRMMRPGTLVISNFHDMGDDWPPEITRRVRATDGLVHPIFLWHIPVDKSRLVPGG
jgi:SAM-dependent methyltransferase